ncbi:type I glyceraldehyde-3-phosphate dehydrogenase [Candidatus Peregrinibacteria bacterium]|nr:type I glyceraldehyde-3-phosphate dehydrogenase [Candidatus Peregrinibacteria bacterium]
MNVALNGYGRIGRNVHRQLFNHPGIDVVAINARTEDAHMRAHLLKYDSVHGKADGKIEWEEGKLIVNGKTVHCLSVKEADQIPWKDYGVDLVLECTGKAKTYDIAARHLVGGAKKVLVSAPMKDDTPTFVIGVNEKDLKPEYKVVSNASCTTNCIAPPLKLIQEKWGILNCFVSSIHSFTHSQNLLDNSGRDLRRARSAVQSVIPTTTGAVKATAQIIPELEGKLDGMAYRVPIATSSICDIDLHLKKRVTSDEVNDFFRAIAKDPYFDPILDICDEPLVSIDFKTNPHSCIIDLGLTMVRQNHYLKLCAWYDNEWGYASRLVDMMGLLAATM